MIYDIESDLTRARVAAACKDFGLEPIQYSAFSGTLNATVRKQLFARLSGTLGKAPGRREGQEVSVPSFSGPVEQKVGAAKIARLHAELL